MFHTRQKKYADFVFFCNYVLLTVNFYTKKRNMSTPRTSKRKRNISNNDPQNE